MRITEKSLRKIIRQELINESRINDKMRNLGRKIVSDAEKLFTPKFVEKREEQYKIDNALAKKNLDYNKFIIYMFNKSEYGPKIVKTIYNDIVRSTSNNSPAKLSIKSFTDMSKLCKDSLHNHLRISSGAPDAKDRGGDGFIKDLVSTGSLRREAFENLLDMTCMHMVTLVQHFKDKNMIHSNGELKGISSTALLKAPRRDNKDNRVDKKFNALVYEIYKAALLIK